MFGKYSKLKVLVLKFWKKVIFKAFICIASTNIYIYIYLYMYIYRLMRYIYIFPKKLWLMESLSLFFSSTSKVMVGATAGLRILQETNPQVLSVQYVPSNGGFVNLDWIYWTLSTECPICHVQRRFREFGLDILDSRY